MADAVKSRQKVVKYILAYFPEDKTTSVIAKERLVSELPVIEFIKEDAPTKNVLDGKKIEAKFLVAAGKKKDEKVFCGYIIAASGKSIHLFFYLI